jgi:hypothetical protein
MIGYNLIEQSHRSDFPGFIPPWRDNKSVFILSTSVIRVLTSKNLKAHLNASALSKIAICANHSIFVSIAILQLFCA